MTDYIKREDAIKAMDTWDKFGYNADCKLVLCTNGLVPYVHFDDMVKAIKGLPSADVAPVRHGHWDVREPMPMHDIKGNLSWGNWYVCTSCGFATTAIEGHITQYKYCPSCGARMDGGEEDE